MRERDHIKSLGRGLKIFEIFGKASRPLTLTEVANLFNLNKALTQRFLNTLCSLGYLIREENKRYFWVQRCFRLDSVISTAQI